MEIYAIGDRDFSVYICTKELIERHLDPENFSAAQAAELLGETVWGKKNGEKMKLELYPGKAEMLIFVHLGFSEPRFVSLGDGESLVQALTECQTEDIELLTYINNAFVLTVYPFSEENTLGGLEEFGEILNVPAEFELYLREHGEYNLSRREIEEIKRLFSAKNRG